MTIDVLHTTESCVYWITGGHFAAEEARKHYNDIWDDSNIEIVECSPIYFRHGFLPEDVLHELEERGPMNGWYEVPKSQPHKRGVQPATKITIARKPR
jgi:hypothetical protein